MIGTFIYGVLALSLVVVTGYAGQVSLAQLALAGVGAFMLSYLTVDWGVPFPFAPILAALAATVVGVLVGLPALRLRGLTFGVVTLALAFGIESIWFRNSQFINSFGNTVATPKLFGLDLGVGIGKDFPRLQFGFMCLIVFVVIAFGVARLRTSALGSAMLAVRGQRTFGRGDRRQRRLREGRQLRDRLVHRRHRGKPPRLPPGHHHLGELRRDRGPRDPVDGLPRR